jgi:transcriptional regulator with XRE-family HTH domain
VKGENEMIDQIKIGRFLRDLRKEKELTQEQLAEKFGVSSRSVSRWENGNTMPELGILVELADYYEVDIKEIIDGERKSEIMEKETKETLLKIADYTDKQIRQAVIRAIVFFGLEMVCCGMTIWAVGWVLNSNGHVSAGYAVIPMIFTFVLSIALVMNAKDYIIRLQRKNSQ